MVTVPGLDRAEELVQLAGEDDFIEFFCHLPLAERTKIAPSIAGSAGGFAFGDYSEIGAGFNLGLELQAENFCIHQDVTGTSRHVCSLA
jgi:hypothetical protein